MKLKLKYAAMFALLVAGCGSHDVTPATAQADQYAPQQIAFPGQDDLRDHLAFNAITRDYDNAGLMHITVPIRNTVDMDATIDYRVTWFDENHNPLDTPTTWQTKTLRPDIWENIQTNSSSPKARDFQMELRYAQ